MALVGTDMGIMPRIFQKGICHHRANAAFGIRTGRQVSNLRRETAGSFSITGLAARI